MTDNETKQLVREAAQEAAQETVRQTFLTMGYDIHNPESLRGLQEDMVWLRNTRTGAKDVGHMVKKATIWTIIGGLLVIIWYGIKTQLGINVPPT